jgi:protein-S-isoprenylcysteine O-methyltransferase Ste14
VIIRRLPMKRSSGLLPRFTALVAALLPFLFFALPKSQLSSIATICSASLLFLGSIGSVFVIFWLGRSFAIMPEARAVVMVGPYKYIRHPLYLAECVGILGLMLEFAQPLSFFVFLLVLSVQIPRMWFEEKVLRDTFPSYRDYANKTFRFLPGIY